MGKVGRHQSRRRSAGAAAPVRRWNITDLWVVPLRSGGTAGAQRRRGGFYPPLPSRSVRTYARPL